MASRDLPARIARRAAAASVVLQPELSAALAGYLELLARWNRKINLTAFELEPASDESIDRLIVEPLAAARHVRPSDRVVIDVGSGGGSPALPLKLAVPQLQFVLVESRSRKAAFLREAVRQLNLREVRVENRRVEDLPARPGGHAPADLVTIRAVRIAPELAGVLAGLLQPRGRVFAFVGEDTDALFLVSPARIEPLVPALRSRLAIFELDRE